MKLTKILSCLTLILFLPVTTWGFGLPKIPGGGKKDSGESSLGSADQQDALIVKYIAAALKINEAQGHLAEAFGMKERAAALAEDNKILSGSDTLNKDQLEQVSGNLKETGAEIGKNMEEGKEMSDDSKNHYAKAVLPYAIGAKLTTGLIPASKDFLTSSKDEIKGAGFGALKLKKKLATGLFIAPKIPLQAKNVLTTTKSLLTYAKKHKIKTPKSATDALGDL